MKFGVGRYLNQAYIHRMELSCMLIASMGRIRNF
jgi:hypothetical protein